MGHDLSVLRVKPYSQMSKGERIAASKAGIIPPVRSHRERQLRTRYGLLLEDFDAMYKRQHGACAICEKSCQSGKLYVDHRHADNHVRGLLCPRCNTAVGTLESLKDVLTRATLYIAYGGAV